MTFAVQRLLVALVIVGVGFGLAGHERSFIVARNRIIHFAVAAACLSLAPACKRPAYPACKKDKHCKAEAGEKCVNGSCQSCTDDSQCAGKGPEGTDWVCHDFRGSDPAAIGGEDGGEDVGAPCAARTDCEGGLACRVGACNMCEEDFDCAPEETLTALATCIGEQGLSVTMEAHADSAGTEEYNIHLTERRGKSIKAYLVGAGAPSDSLNLNVIAKGNLEAVGTSESERAKDRRVQFFTN